MVVNTFGIGAALRFGHREAGHDPVVQQRLEVALLQLGRAVVREDLTVAGIGCLRTEHDRRAFGAAEDLVEQRQFHLTVAGSAQMRAEVGGPQAALLDDLLQRRNERLADRVVEVVRLLDDQIDRLAFRAHELDRPRPSCSAHSGSVEKSHAIGIRPSVSVTRLPPCRGVVGGVAEHLVAVLQLQRRVGARGVGVHLQRALRQLHSERRQFGDR